MAGTFYYLCSVLDGHSRFLVHGDLRESMTEAEIEIILQAAREKYPEAKPRIISDNGPQFIARDFQEFIRICGMTHVRTSPYYPQSNGKIERWHPSLKSECIRPGTPLSVEDARRLIQRYVHHYNTVRLHSAIGFVTPQDMLASEPCRTENARFWNVPKNGLNKGYSPDSTEWVDAVKRSPLVSIWCLCLAGSREKSENWAEPIDTQQHT